MPLTSARCLWWLMILEVFSSLSDSVIPARGRWMLGSPVTWSKVAVRGPLPAMDVGERGPGVEPAPVTGGSQHLRAQGALRHRRGDVNEQPSAGGRLAPGRI